MTAMSVAPWIWAVFVTFILSMLALDLFVFHRDAHEVSTREASFWVGIWVSLGVAFTAVIWLWMGAQSAVEYISGYLLEYSLSADNIFVFVLIFTYFAVPATYQHRVLFWGIVGALVFRASFIAAGAALIHRFDFVLYIFGAFLVFTGIRMAIRKDVEIHPDHNPVLRLSRRLLPMTPSYRGQRFFVRESSRRLATPLFAVLVVVETTDIVFAVDSIPAIFGITRNPFIVFTSNAFAILGLRALYFLLARMMKRFAYLQIGLSVILVFVGLKMLVNELIHLPAWVSLGFILVTLALSVVLSLRVEARKTSENEVHADESPDLPRDQRPES